MDSSGDSVSFLFDAPWRNMPVAIVALTVLWMKKQLFDMLMLLRFPGHTISNVHKRRFPSFCYVSVGEGWISNGFSGRRFGTHRGL